MCSIRKGWVASASLAGLLISAAGCQFVRPKPTERLNMTPVVVDEAMQRRNWDRTIAYYQNGATIAGPTGVWARTDPTIPVYLQGAAETPIFFGQVATMPGTAIFAPPWEDVAYPGLRMEPTYTASPPTDADY